MRQTGWVFVLVALLACPAWADIINGSFETGDFTGWLIDELQGTAQVVAGGTEGDWVACLAPEGRDIWNGEEWVFSDGRVHLWQEDIDVPCDARFLLFDAWVQGYGLGYVSFPGPAQEVVVSSIAPVTYAIDVSAIQGTTGSRLAMKARDTDVGDNYVYLDNVRFSDIPEPGSFGLCLSGMLALWTLCRKR
jgi:hypothetical protein